MYDAYERLRHWLQTLVIILLLFTGLVIHRLDIFGWFSFRHIVTVHNVLAAILAINAGMSLFWHLEGGINNWIATFGEGDPDILPVAQTSGEDTLNYTFPAALGDRYECASPSPHEWQLEFLPKIKLEFKRDKSGGGCG